MPAGQAAKAVDKGLSWGTPSMSDETLEELTEVLSRIKFDRYVSREDRQHFLHLLGGIARMTSVTQRITACRDPKDDKFLDVALNGDAELLLTGDQDLLELHPFHGVEILKPADFLNKPID
jgi:putative PIN family toxin of toxin-antitoxin system